MQQTKQYKYKQKKYQNKCKVTPNKILSIADKDAEHKGNFVYLDNKCNMWRAG